MMSNAMDNNKRLQLERYRADIINDLEATFIIDELFSRRAITSEQYDKINIIRDREEQVKALLNSVLRNGNSSYEAFVATLAKDYYWLREKLVMEDKHQINNDSFEDSLSRGDLPRLLDHQVRRMELEQDVASKLEQLNRHNILVIFGMSGSGKTCVVISTLRNNPELITKKFNNVVFWLNLGNCKTDDDIVDQQNKLLRKASSICVTSSWSYIHSSVSMSSIGSNADTSLSSYNWKWEDLKDTLKSQFLQEPLKECLLVLDEVNDKKCLEAFDVGCKILITTRDIQVVSNYHPQIVKIKNSLEEKETLEIFASCIQVPVSRLPARAKKLHELCKGSPFQIGLIGAQLAENRERLMHYPNQWNYYIKNLKKENFLLRRYQTNNRVKTIEVCLSSLNENLNTLFKKLKILPDNVQVSTKVLSKLWNKDIGEVEIIMKELKSKSLVIETYDREQRNYMYEIHDLIMNYLRSTDNEDTKKLNDDFLNSYNYGDINSPPVDIIDDGYIAYYIGYHIKNTENYDNKWNLFNKLFMDLKFLGNKVRLTGSADVILDLQKYERDISKNELDRELLYNIRGYLSTYGRDLHRYPCTDIVQSILQHESKGMLYNEAIRIAQRNCAKNELYFEFLHEQEEEDIKRSTTIDVKEHITAVCFFGEYVLIGTLTGVIKFFYVETNKLRKELLGTGSPIKWIGVSCSQNPPIVAALSDDGYIKLWRVDDLNNDDSDGTIEEEPEESYNNNYTDVETIPPKLGRYINCRWSNNEEFLIMHTNEMIVLYNPSLNENSKILQTIEDFGRGHSLLSSVPCNHDKYIVVATCSNLTQVEMINMKTKEKVMTFEETDIVLDIVTVPGSNRIFTLKSNEVTEHEVKIYPLKSNKNTYKSRRVIASEQIKDNLKFVCIAINRSGTYLFVSTDDSRVICIDLKNYASFDLENCRGNVIAMAVSEMIMWDEFAPSTDVLLTGTGTMEDFAKVWYLDASYLAKNAQKNGKVRLTTKFDASFVHAVSPHTPSTSSTTTATNSGAEDTTSTPRRHQSFANHREMISKKALKNTKSLDRHFVLDLRGISNDCSSRVSQPLLAVIDDKNNIQIMRGRKVLTEITGKPDEHITRVKITPCNQYVIYGLKSGAVKRFQLRTKETVTIMDLYSPVTYLNFMNPEILIAAGKNRCLMGYRLSIDGIWKTEMLQKGNNSLGSQEIINEIQGTKPRNGQPEKLSGSSSEGSITSRGRLFPNAEAKSLYKCSSVVDCFWIRNLGLITVEDNATIKLWDKCLKLSTILNGRQPDVYITSASLQNNILVICDKYNKRFQTFELVINEELDPKLSIIQEYYTLNNQIISCDLTSDGNILAMGLDSGIVVIWNVKGQRQLTLLKHHSTKVNWCSFSPVPQQFFPSNMAHNSSFALSNASYDEDQPPLVLVSMATEIVWWNISYLLKMRSNKPRWSGFNALTPLNSPNGLYSPTDHRSTPQQSLDNLNVEHSRSNLFFADGDFPPHRCWRTIWKGKTCKEGSKKKEILACIKLNGMNAKTLRYDDTFSCFVTVDYPGHVHIMNVMRPRNT